MMDSLTLAPLASGASTDRGQARTWAERLRQAGTSFNAPFVGLEQTFLSFGDRLRELHRKVMVVSQDAETAGDFLASAEFNDMLGALAESTDAVDNLRQARTNASQPLADIAASTGTMLGALDALSRIMSQVQVLAINAKIESSQLVQTGVDFTIFTNEITRLAGCGSDAIDGVRRELSHLRRSALEAHSVQCGFEQKGMVELETLNKRLGASMASLWERQSMAADGVREMLPLLQSLSGHVGRVVADLQIFDMTRQRLEHVEQALDIAADMIAADDASGMDETQLRVFANGIAELQAIQLVQAAEAYDQAISDVGDGMKALAKGVPVIASISFQAFGGGRNLSVAEVKGDLENAIALFAEFAATHAQAQRALTQAAETARRAGGMIRSLNSVNADMRLMGLNASIKCGNMGSRARTLQVVANELQAYSGQTRAHVEKVADDLARSVKAADQIAACDDAVRAGDIQTLNDALRQAVARLGDAGTRLTELLGGISGNAAAVVELGSAAAQDFAGQIRCAALIAPSLNDLKALAAESAPDLSGNELEVARRDVLAFAEQHYTMASERVIHGGSVGGQKLAELLKGGMANVAASGTSARTSEPDISDLLF